VDQGGERGSLDCLSHAWVSDFIDGIQERVAVPGARDEESQLAIHVPSRESSVTPSEVGAIGIIGHLEHPEILKIRGL
jgi:hypothetical protein